MAARGRGIGLIRVQLRFPNLVSAAPGVQPAGATPPGAPPPSIPALPAPAAEHVAPALGSHFALRSASQERSRRSQTWARGRTPDHHPRSIAIPAGDAQYARRPGPSSYQSCGHGILTSVQGNSGARTHHPLVKGGSVIARLVKWLLGKNRSPRTTHPPGWERRRFRFMAGGGEVDGKACS